MSFPKNEAKEIFRALVGGYYRLFRPRFLPRPQEPPFTLGNGLRTDRPVAMVNRYRKNVTGQARPATMLSPRGMERLFMQ